MRIISATTRVTIGLVCLGVSVWLIAFALGMFPDTRGADLRGRAALCECVALHCSLSASRNDTQTMEASLNALVTRNEDIQSAAVRCGDGQLLVAVGPHEGHWNLPSGNESTESQMRVPILAGDTDWGTVEVRFRDSSAAGAASWLCHPLVGLAAFVAAATYLLYFYYLRKMLQHLDPSRVVPKRVRQTLNTLAEGLLVLDLDERILLANQSFAKSMGASVNELTGRRASELPWETEATRPKIDGYPWQRALRENAPQLGDLLTIHGEQTRRRVLKVNATPVYGEDGGQRGAMASFDDVTEIEKNRTDLQKMLNTLSKSRDKIHRQNLELERLASRDPLTGCLNRRAFFTELDNHWWTSERHGYPLACIMVDLDHFKAVNDTHGHQIGDAVLKMAADALRTDRRPSDLICRYGGEEFCLLLPHTDLQGAAKVAEQIRGTILSTDFDGIAITASLGITARSMGARDPQQLIDQADKCLYVAKHGGRNQVVRIDQSTDQIAARDELSARSMARDDSATKEVGRDPSIPFHAVTALVSALAYRDWATADHSRRVADLCVITARPQMSVGDSYVLEIAALLHDIGKVGVPDSVLRKPSSLTDEEWQVMNSLERIGFEIVHSTFSSPKLAEIIRTYRAWYGGDPLHPGMPTGDAIPFAARILAIADAYDSMTNRSAYREPLSRAQAFGELRRCGGRQFDPELVERFIVAVSDRDRDDLPAEVDAPKDAALCIGAQIEQLAEALDDQKLNGIAALAGRVSVTAVKHSSERIAQVASKLQDATRDEEDLEVLLQLTNELVDLCRSVQRTYLNQAVGHASSAAGDQLLRSTS